jgi:hypothetical protein
MDLAERYTFSATKIKDGVDFDMGGAIFKLTYYQSSKVQLFITAELNKLIAQGIPHAEAVILAMRAAIVNVVVLGWSNLQEDKVEIPYSMEECERIINTYEGLDIAIMEKAMEASKFRMEKREETKEKSLQP